MDHMLEPRSLKLNVFYKYWSEDCNIDLPYFIHLRQMLLHLVQAILENDYKIMTMA